MVRVRDRPSTSPSPYPNPNPNPNPSPSPSPNPSTVALTYPQVDLLIDKDASSRQRQRVAEVVIHELAHQWFGNLVTMDWWDDLT